MRRNLRSCLPLLPLMIFLLAGCATNRGIVSIDVPHDETAAAQQNGPTVYIQSVEDQRIFQDHPKTQDIPSLGFGGLEKADEAIKKRAIARKRNSFGKALGDILLEEGQTVETVIADSLRQAFTEKGYQVIENREDISDDTIVVNAAIKKFWAYMTPGFWAITLSCDIATDIELISDSNIQKQISVHSDGKYQVGTEDNWMEVINITIKKYIDKVKEEI